MRPYRTLPVYHFVCTRFCNVEKNIPSIRDALQFDPFHCIYFDIFTIVEKAQGSLGTLLSGNKIGTVSHDSVLARYPTYTIPGLN